MMKKVLVICLIFLGMLSLLINLVRADVVTEKEMNDYIKTYLDTYNQKVELLDKEFRANFTFYQNSPYKILGAISSQRGAAVIFIPSDRGDIETSIIGPVIDSVFPSDDNFIYVGSIEDYKIFRDYWISVNLSIMKNATKIILQNDELHLEGNSTFRIFSDELVIHPKRHISKYESPPIALYDNSVLIIENSMIMKANNSIDFWSKENAIQDATYAFEREKSKIALKEIIIKIDESIQRGELGIEYSKLSNKAKGCEKIKDRVDYNICIGEYESLAIDLNMSNFQIENFYEEETKPLWENPIILIMGAIVIFVGFIKLVLLFFRKKKYQ